MPLRNVEFQHGGKTLGLRFSQNAKLRFERESGRPSPVAFEAMAKGVGFASDLHLLFWACLEGWRIATGSTQKPMSVNDVGEMMDEIGEVEAVGLLVEAVKSAAPPKAEDDQAENPTTAG